MSGLAKAFVVINLILAIFFLGSVSTLFTVQEGWKQAAEDAGQALDDLEGRADQQAKDLKGTIDSLQNSNDGLTANVENLQSEKRMLEDNVRDLRTANGEKDKQISTFGARIELLEGQIADARNTIETKENRIHDLTQQAGDAEEAKKAAAAAMNRAVLDRQNMASELEDASAQLATITAERDDLAVLIETAQHRGIDFSTVVGVPKIDGQVVAVREGVIVLSVGRDDGVQVGYEFEIYDGRSYVGKVRVETILDDMSGAKILYTDSGRKISTGQSASTRLAG